MNGSGIGPIALVMLAMHFARIGERPVLYPWDLVRSEAFIVIANPTAQGPFEITITAPEIDGATRSLGSIGPRDTIATKSPYADAVVTIHVGPVTVPLKIDRPLVVRITLKENK